MTTFNNYHDALDSVELGHLIRRLKRTNDLAAEIDGLLRQKPAVGPRQLAQLMSRGHETDSQS